MNPVRNRSSQDDRSRAKGRTVSNGVKTFREKVFDVVRKIPEGKVVTYKEVARRAGNEKASRAVGAILRTNYAPDIPCHRVIHSNGVIGNYNRGGSLAKAKILKKEGYVSR
jgi:O-6-methylguanine DNA methyltransferase